MNTEGPREGSLVGREPDSDRRAEPVGQEPGRQADAPNNRSTPEAAPTGEALTDEQIDALMPAPSKLLPPHGFNYVGFVYAYTAEQVRSIVRAALSTHPSAPVAPAGWQPIETAPKDGTLFLCWVSAVQHGESDEGQQYQVDVSQADFCQWQAFEEAPDGGWFEPCCGQISDQQAVTHWMPLPATPSAEAQPTPKEN